MNTDNHVAAALRLMEKVRAVLMDNTAGYQERSLALLDLSSALTHIKLIQDYRISGMAASEQDPQRAPEPAPPTAKPAPPTAKPVYIKVELHDGVGTDLQYLLALDQVAQHFKGARWTGTSSRAEIVQFFARRYQ